MFHVEQKKYKIYKNMYQREHFFRLIKNGLEVVFSLISENQNAETLQFDLSKCERIKIEYTSPSFVGVKTLTTQKYGGNYYEIVGENKIKIVLSNLHNAPYLLNGVAFYGSYTLSICSLQIDVPSNVSKGIQDLGEITQVVVKSFEIGGGGGGGFTPTETQLQAINSGATAGKITQIATNSNDIENLFATKQDKITDSTQAGDLTDSDYLSDLNGTNNKRWTFAKIWEFIKTKVDVLLEDKADKATTLSGYGITDAYTKSEVDTELAKKIDKTSIKTSISSSLTDNDVVSGKAIYDKLNIETLTGSSALTNSGRTSNLVLTAISHRETTTRVFKRNGVCTLNLYLQMRADTAFSLIWLCLGSIASGYRPSTRTALTFCTWSYNPAVAAGYVDTDGKIWIWCSSITSGQTNLQFITNASWML